MDRLIQRTNVRYRILLIIFMVTTISYADRATLSLVGSDMQKELGINAAQMGLLFSAFAWAYVLAQVPSGWLIDRFGVKKVYIYAILFWSIFTALQASVGLFSLTMAVTFLFVMRFFVGLFEGPSFPSNSILASAWFPSSERGTAAGIFTSSQYFSGVIFAPLMGWIVYSYSWHYVFLIMGALGILMAALVAKKVYLPDDHPSVNQAEIDYIRSDNTDSKSVDDKKIALNWKNIKQLLKNRMMLGIFISQYCINNLSYFFLTWFPIYLVQEKGMSILKAGIIASVPALCGFFGGVCGGVFSDYLIRKGVSLTISRKLTLVLGMMMSMVMVAANYIDIEWAIVSIMAIAYFGKGFGAIGWAVISDTAPKQLAGICGGIFNSFGNAAGIVTPLVIGLILQKTSSFEIALTYVSAHAFIAIFCYLFVVGKIKRLDTKTLGIEV